MALSKLAIDKEHPALGKTTIHVTQISGGERHNVIPDRCKLVVDIRTTPSLSPDEIIALVKKTVEGEGDGWGERLARQEQRSGEKTPFHIRECNRGASR